MAEEVTQIRIAISADSNARVEFELGGDRRLVPTLLGGIEIVKPWLIEQAKNSQVSVDTTEKIAEERHVSKPSEQVVSKPEALAAYRYAISCLAARCEEIQKAPDMKFRIDSDLLSKL